jgi:hypothetical protein
MSARGFSEFWLLAANFGVSSMRPIAFRAQDDDPVEREGAGAGLGVRKEALAEMSLVKEEAAEGAGPMEGDCDNDGDATGGR